MTKFLALIAVAALMVSACDPAFAGRRHRNRCCHNYQFHGQAWSSDQHYGNAQLCCNGNAGYFNGQNGYSAQVSGYSTQGTAGTVNEIQNAPVPVTTGYPPSEDALDNNANSSRRTNSVDVNIDNRNSARGLNSTETRIDSPIRSTTPRTDTNVNPRTDTNVNPRTDTNLNPRTDTNNANPRTDLNNTNPRTEPAPRPAAEPQSTPPQDR